MDILQQCQQWHDKGQYQKIISALESIDAGERTPEMDSELARACNNLADPDRPEGRKLLKKAIALLKPHEEYFAGNHFWNFRMGYAYFYLEQEGQALPYFQAALEACPDDGDTQEFIGWCKKRIALPQFSECFRERAERWWKCFSGMEGELCRIMDGDKDHVRGGEIADRIDEALNGIFDDISFEVGFNGEKYELILTPEGDKVKLFELAYLKRYAPKGVLERWNILAGRQPMPDFSLCAGGWEISGEDVQIWLEEQGKNSFALSAYCEKLLPVVREEEGRAWWLLTTLADQVLGEIPHMRYIDSFDVLKAPKEEPSILMSRLPDKLREKGLDLSADPQEYLETYMAYEMKPNEDPEADWRLDVIAGSTCCIPLLRGYLDADGGFIDGLHADGAAAGFFCYPLDTLREEEGSQKIFDFRDKLETALTAGDGQKILTLTGGATGLYFGYVDFIAWDLGAVLNKAKEFFADSGIPWAGFHTFRREAGTVTIKTPEDDGPDAGEPEEEGEETSSEMDGISYTPKNAGAFYQKLGQWNEKDEYTRCIRALNSVSEEWRDYRYAYALARALENYAIIGDHDKGTPKPKGDAALLRAIQVLESVREEGQDKAEWNMRMAYGYQYLDGQEEKAIPYAKRWMELDPEDKNAPAVIQECREEIQKRRRGRDRKAGSVPGGTPFEGFDFTNFWDDNKYALDEYVSAPPTDELIASVEEELGYKLPASYIWLMKQHNGGIPVNTCYPTDEPTSWAEDHVAITGIFGIGREKSYSLCGELGSQFMIGEWGYPAIGVAICDCPSAGHDMIFLDYRACGPQGEPEVVHVDQENDYQITRLAGSFEEFIRGLEHESVYNLDEDEGAPGGEDERDGEETGLPELYTEEEMETVEGHMKRYFGAFDGVFHEIVSPDIHVDICVVPPSEERGHFTLVTMGMGAHRMNVPKELAEYKLERAELAIALPADWKLDERSLEEERWYWPVRLLKTLARLPIAGDTWLGVGHTMDQGEDFAEGTKLCAAVLTDPQGIEEGGGACTLPGGETVNFYQVIPLYRDELEYKLEHGADALLDKMEGLSFLADPDRPDGIAGDSLWDGDEGDGCVGEMDNAVWHLETIGEKGLAVDAINAYNHMAIYLRWCMEHNLMGEGFLREYGGVVKQVRTEPGSVDLRAFLRDELDGQLAGPMFNRTGRAFASYYYGEPDSPYFPSDIDDHAIGIIGQERNDSDEIQDEAYLFIPFDEDYYQAMAEVIGERFANWQGQEFDEETFKPSALAEAMMEYLDCECAYFPSMKDDDPITAAFGYAKRDSAREGFVPVLLRADDETLLECLVMNADPEHDGDCYEFDAKTVAEYRRKMLEAPLKDGKAVLEKLAGACRAEAAEDGLDWDREVIGKMEGGEPNDRFSSYWNPGTDMTYPLILAKIPVKNPWEIFAYLPFGGWNECPDTPELMAAAKYWFEQYGAVPAAMTHDELEFILPAPIPREKAMEAAIEQYGFCPDLDQGEEGGIGILADVLRQSDIWYFWWD